MFEEVDYGVICFDCTYGFVNLESQASTSLIECAYVMLICRTDDEGARRGGGANDFELMTIDVHA